MPNAKLKKITICILLPLVLNACAPIIPENYLGPSNIRTPQKIDGKWVSPRIIPVSTKMLQSPEGRLLLDPAMKPQPYKVGAYDGLNVIVWGHPEISTVGTSTAPIPGMRPTLANVSTLTSTVSNPPVIVQSDGTIFYPYVGHLKVAGLTVDEIQQIMTKRLSEYIRNPQVTIQISKYSNRNIYVLGEVFTPGMQPITDKPLTWMEAISAAGGINPANADPRHIYLIRGSYEQPDIYWLDAESPQSLIIAEQFPLQQSDIVYVSGATLNGVSNFFNKVVPTFSNYFAIKAGVNS